MWILEVFPEFKQKRGYFEGQTIPRFLGWKEGHRLLKVHVDGILANAVKVTFLYYIFFAWMLHMYNSRDPSARWSILPPYFQMYLQTLDQKFACYFNGKVEPFPPIYSVDEVYVPLFIPSIHWFLGVFNLVNETLTIYDSLMGVRDLDKGRTEVVCHINFVFDHWLRLHGYYDNKPLPFKFPFQTEYANDVPQQSGPLGDCGVWVCIFLDRLINKKPLNDGEKTSKTATRMRRHMLTLFYNSLIPLELLNELEEDDLEFIQ
ncbi:putative Ulp1 protease family catalytic domain, papain-like cysteine peptidase superfamily [Helianthus debilis subsp. tardiflorus]